VQGLAVVGANYGETRCPYHVRWMAEAGVFMALLQIDTALLQINGAFFRG